MPHNDKCRALVIVAAGSTYPSQVSAKVGAGGMANDALDVEQMLCCSPLSTQQQGDELIGELPVFR